MISVVYCTRQTNPAHQEHLMKSSGLHKHIEIIEIINNGESLTKAYNRGLKQAKNNIVVFCHDDLTVETKQWGHKLLKLFERHPDYGVIGVAGTKFMSASGQWWENRKKMYGRVAHTHEGKTWLSSYSEDMGQDIEETVVVDGVFFAVDKSKLKHDFDENFEGFHFYDVSFCFQNYLKGVKIGVVTAIRVNHQSIGMTNESWEANRVKFAETFKDNLPVEIKKVLRKGQKLKVLVGCLNYKGESPEEKYITNLMKQLVKLNCDVTLVTNTDKRYTNLAKQLGVTKIFTLQEPPGFKLGDGKWHLKSAQGDVVSQANTLYKLSDIDFDLMHLSQKPVIDHLTRLYPDVEVVASVLSNNKQVDEPSYYPMITKYLTTSEELRDMLVNEYSIDASKIDIVTPEPEPVVKQKLRKGPIKIVTGWSDRGGSTNAFIALTNALNKAGYDATLYGPHTWHLDKCKSAMHDKLSINPNDRLIAHFIQLPNRPNAGKVILSCHEKNLYEVGKIKPFWDEVVFINQRHREYHNEYNGKYTIIPNLKEPLIKRDKTGLEKIAGVIGSFDDNKQTHISIQRALADGMDMVYLFGEPSGAYYESYVKPLLSDKVKVMGFSSDKQGMYDMLGCVYHSSKSEVACLVKDECESTGVEFKGNEATDNPPVLLTNDEILKQWVKLLEF